MIIVLVALVLVSALAAWKAELIGKALRGTEGGRLVRSGEFGGDVRAYTFFVRVGSISFGFVRGCWA